MVKRLVAVLLLMVAMVGTAVAVPSSDEGIRRRLDGCWDFATIGVRMCFDGVDRVELREGGKTVTGTYTVFGGRVMFDTSPEANPSREIYPSCSVDIALENDTSVDFLRCSNWGLMRLEAALPGRNKLTGKHTSSTWLDTARYAGQARSSVGAPLKGCWSAERSREREQMVQEGIKQFGFYLSAYYLCFDGNRRGKTVSTAFDFDDGWDSGGTFLFINGRLVLRDDFAADGETRCAIAIEGDTLRMFDCANWNRGPAGRMVATHAEEPSILTREAQK